MSTRARDVTLLALFHWFYLRHPGRALHYARAQTRLYGWRWVFGVRYYKGRRVGRPLESL